MMNNKKGFTLIELLAVIALLALLIILIIPSIIGVYNKTKKSTFEVEIQNILKAAQNKYALMNLNGEPYLIIFEYIDGKENSSIENQKLDLSKSNPQNGKIIILETGKIGFALHNGTWCAQKSYEGDDIIYTNKSKDECKIQTPLLVLTLNGENSLCLSQNEVYTDPGATAISGMGVDITSLIIKTITLDGNIVSTIDTSIPGSYEISYEVTDNGETATAKRKVNIANPIMNFYYTGAEQVYTVTCPGNYKLEVWGAQGGNVNGTGGYSSGIIALESNQKLYIHVGGQGVGINGGYNGGGNGGNGYGVAYGSAYGGGGATDIRLISGLWNGNDGLYSRIIVAGGGGGRGGSAYKRYSSTIYPEIKGGTAGVGGGLTSTAGSKGQGEYSTGGNGGGSSSQSAGGTFGEATRTYYSSSSSDTHYSGGGGAGGGGWFGGGGAGGGSNAYKGLGSNGTAGSFGVGGNGGAGRPAETGWYPGAGGGGAGGSGYVLTVDSYKPVGYNLDFKYYMNDISILSGNQTMPNPTGGTMVGKLGNGYARITLQ